MKLVVNKFHILILGGKRRRVSTPSMERGQGSTSRGMSGSKLREGGVIYSLEGQSTTAGSQQRHSGAGSQQGDVGEDVNQQHQGFHQFQYFFIKFVQLFLHLFFIIYEILYILMQRPKMFELVVKIDAG